MKIKYYILLVVAFLGMRASAQQKNKLDVFQDSLIKLSTSTIAAATDEKKAEVNGRFVKTMVEALKTPNSFTYGFDSLKNVSVIKSPDQAFRILSWYIQQSDGTYRYYGTIQMNTNNGPLKLYPLIDQTENLADENSITDNQKWLGARYYEIVPIKSGNRLPYYILLGWKGNTESTTKKIIEVLTFNNNNVVFGAPVFDGKALKGKNRIIFEYTKSNAMYLKTDQKAGMIVFDHLAPFDPEMVGRFEFYGSDGTFDGFKVIGGRLKLQENLTLNNDPTAMDELYADPSKNLKPNRKF
ncbi:hypothetical protein [Pedobacter endophyticus]|uniref:Uncharacterized protein n=1 Tax=Pedobacter endophyticus TaxID=2789740 RepID=A0A7S9L0A3_9SPHI|nr:hypothetical protein [Pedobacter endophyticus]QPH40134.1 hypothetical protein IZT61_02305 [Pedobacter endophyticus]